MSEDFFSGLSAWWRESWQAGASAPSFGPTVGRGLFSNWFLSERDRETAELEALYARGLAQYKASPCYDGTTVREVVEAVLTQAFARSELEPSTALIEVFYPAIDTLISEELDWFPGYAPGAIAHINLRQRVFLRSFLLEKRALYADLETHTELIKSELGTWLAALYDDIAPDAPSAGADAHGLVLTMGVGGIAPHLPQLIDQAIHLMCGDGGPIFKHNLFSDVREQMMRNLAVASGINPDGPPSEKPWVMAQDVTGAAPGDLLDTYLVHTPLRAILDAPVPLVIPASMRSEHTLIVGGSGHGKTQLLQKLIHHDLTDDSADAPGVVVIDSQGDLIHTLSQLALFDPERADSLADRFILIDPNDVDYPVALNLFAFDERRLERYSRADRQRVLNSVIDLYEYFFCALLGAELTQKQGVVFRYLARLMMVIPKATVHTLRALMEDGKPYQSYMDSLEGSARQFFKSEFFSPGFAATKKQILRRLWGVLANEVFERMFSHPDNKLDLFEAMNSGKIILINTAKDMLKTEGCSIFGRFFIAKIAQAALERATVGEEARRPVHVYIDEAHDYFDDQLDHLFNQARKYRVGLHVAAQHLDQLPTRLKSTVMASTALKFAGGVSAKDARALADDMRTEAAFIRGTKKRRGRSEFAAYVKNLTPHAVSIQLELGWVNAQETMSDEQFAQLIARNRSRYCVPIEQIEALIAAATRDEGCAPDTPHEPTPGDVPPEPNLGPKPLEEQVDRSELSQPPVQPTPKPKLDPGAVDRYLAGVGSREHRKIQDLVRQLAQERNFKATIEKPILDGKGSVDVALEHPNLSIAVEVSLTTDAAHEWKNVKKAIEAGFDEVFLVVPDPKKRGRFREALLGDLPSGLREPLSIFGPEEVGTALDERAAKLASSRDTIRGWRVTTTFAAVSPEEARAKRAALAKVLAATTTKNDTKL